MVDVPIIPDPDPGRVQNLLFITIPPEYLFDRVVFFAQNGIDGFMLSGIMHNWDDDVWAQPAGYTPDTPKGRIVGEANPLFQLFRRVNERCRAAGITSNSVKVAFYKPLPDWFDDAGWEAIAENFRQCALFARGAGFAGVTIDIEYIAEMYELTYEAYRAPGYPVDRLRDQARLRGRQITAAMIEVFPDMVNWHLPHTVRIYGPLGVSLFAGMVDGLAEKNAPGGIHMCTEGMYLVTRPDWVVDYNLWIETAIETALRASGDDRSWEYWKARCSIATGIWPLGYYRKVTDPTGKFLGYSGREETFGDAIVGSYADKSPNYSPEEFRVQYAAVRSSCRKFSWVYGHGSVLWQMNEAEKQRYHGSASDTLPTAPDLPAYLAVMRERPLLGDCELARRAAAIREGATLPLPEGTPPRWWHIGPFACAESQFDLVREPERTVDLDARLPVEERFGKTLTSLRWKSVPVDRDGYVDLREHVSGEPEALAYSVTWLEIPRAVDAVLRFGGKDFAAVFLNGVAVYRSTRARQPRRDEDAVPLHLPAGRSCLLVKCDNRRRVWGFYLRITDEQGRAVPSFRWVDPPA